MEGFRFDLTGEEKAYLKDVVRRSIEAGLTRDGEACWKVPEPPTDKLREHLGAFVCLHIGQELRGCIGHIMSDAPLYQTVAQMAQAAAFQDPRFTPLSPDEFKEVLLEISILGPISPCPDPNLVEVGRHGLIVRQGHCQGLLLPQVPVEWGWDREKFLEQTCRKAGLPAKAWRSPDTAIYWFEAVVF